MRGLFVVLSVLVPGAWGPVAAPEAFVVGERQHRHRHSAVW